MMRGRENAHTQREGRVFLSTSDQPFWGIGVRPSLHPSGYVTLSEWGEELGMIDGEKASSLMKRDAHSRRREVQPAKRREARGGEHFAVTSCKEDI